MLAWIHKYATFCDALFSMMWRIPQKCKQNFGGDLSTITTLMFAVLHVLLNSSSREYTEHPWKVYTSILGVSCPPLLGWCSQCYSHITYTHVNTQYASFCNTPLSRMQSTSLRSVWSLSHQVMLDESQECWIVFMWTLSSHITYMHVNTQICIFL